MLHISQPWDSGWESLQLFCFCCCIELLLFSWRRSTFPFFTLQRIAANFALGAHLPRQPEDPLLVQQMLPETNFAYFLPGGLMWADSSGVAHCGNERRLGSIIYILETNSLFQRTTDLVPRWFLYNPVLMLSVSHPESPWSTWVLQLQQVGSVPSPAHVSLFLAWEHSQHPGECPLKAGGTRKCRDISDPGTIHFITHTGQSWVLSTRFLRGSPVGTSPIIHDGDLPMNGSLVAFLPSQAHVPPGLPGLTFQKDCMHSRLGLRSCFRRNPDYDTCFFPGRIQGIHKVYVTCNMSWLWYGENLGLMFWCPSPKL